MSKALNEAGLKPSEVDYVNTHGTSTPLNARHETKAINAALGEEAFRIPLSSTKSMTGHLLGSGGALEACFCILAMENSIIPPTINLSEPDPDCDLDYTPNYARSQELNVTLSNSFGFGGHNSVLIMSKSGLGN